MAVVQHLHQRQRSAPAPRPAPTPRTAQAKPSPKLEVVVRPRRTLQWVAVVVAVLFATMLGAAWFQTQLAQRQVQLDQLDHDMRAETRRHVALRAQRAELRAAQTLFEAAPRLGLVPADRSRTATIDPELIALVEMYTPRPSTTARPATATDELERIGGVKAASRPRQ